VLQDYNLQKLQLPYKNYSFQQTLQHIDLFLRLINGEQFNDNTGDLFLSTGILQNLFNVDEFSSNLDNDVPISYQFDEILDFYIVYLENIITQCERTFTFIQRAQENFLQRRYSPSGQLASKAKSHFYDLAK
jgi:hypothetical protein